MTGLAGSPTLQSLQTLSLVYGNTQRGSLSKSRGIVLAGFGYGTPVHCTRSSRNMTVCQAYVFEW